ncbi:hypothetical protein BLOT_005345 [Blomia tropicalis]|nr:hypothetical protein BLOT_005345 [Blomia tropicalis]
MGISDAQDVEVRVDEKNEYDPQPVDKLMNGTDEHGNDDADDKKCDNNNNNVNFISINIETNRNEQPKSKGFTIFGYRLSQIKWTNVIWLLFIHTLAVIGYIYLTLYPVKFWSVWWAILLALFGGFGVSVGAHRLWAHRSFKANWFLRFVLVFMETFSMNGGCYSYARDHRCHHKFVDTNGDPKNAKRGFSLLISVGGW